MILYMDAPPIATFRWPDRPIVRTHKRFEAPHAPGVYVLQFEDGLYIGSSKDLRKRLHCWQTRLGMLPKFRLIVTDDYRYQEQRLIERCQRRGIPLANKNRAVQKKLFRRD